MFQSKRNWIVKLVDFGSAQFTKEAVKPTELDFAWAAPELHIKDTPVTVQSDVWGMGVITFCLRRMRTDEALSHRFLSSDPQMVRRRESIKYSASRLRKTTMLTNQSQTRPE
ncbi:hypothetical protein OESDEN_15588, partial [Oesophagostomum dentatum]